MKKLFFSLIIFSCFLVSAQEINFNQFTFKNIGPTIMSGRVVDVAVNPNQTNEFYVAYASGGLWFTNNNGNSFEPVMDSAPTQNIGSIAVDWNSGLIIVGTGEINSSRSSYAGIGVLKSNDKGKTWQNIGLTDSHHISKVVINPNNNNEIVVGVLGHLYSENAERGIFKTTDGGKTWNKTLFVNNETGVVDISVSPKNPKIMFASAWERSRKAYNFKGNGENSGIYKSTDGGDSWTKIENQSGFKTDKGTGRIGLTSFNDKIAYAVVDNQNLRPNAKDAKMPDNANAALFETEVIGAEIYKTTDAGLTWKKMNDSFIDDCYYSYGYYFGDITVDAANENRIYVTGVPLLFSADGGKTFEAINKDNVHADHHVCWINPKNANHVINGNDGGINITYDNGAHWYKCNNQAVGQFYSINVDETNNYKVYGGLQDNGVWAGPNDYVHNLDWQQEGKYPYEFLSGGDGMQVQIDNRNTNIIYTGYQFGNYYKIDKRAGANTYITPKAAKDETPYRFNWQTPILLSSFNQDIVYFAGQYMFRSMNQGKNWEKISPDLTNGKVEGNVPFGSITCFAESKFKFGQLIVGTDDGNVQLTKNGGESWTKISDNLPKGLWVSRVRFSTFNKERIYITLNNYRNDDFKTYVYVSEDLGNTWQSLSDNIKFNAANVILEDTVNENILYLGTDSGLYISMDKGLNWQDFSNEMPIVAVHDLVIQAKAKDLIVGTHGRSLYKLKIENLQKYDTVKNKEISLFSTETVKFSRSWGEKGFAWSPANEPSTDIWFFSKTEGNVVLKVNNDKNVTLFTTNIKATKGYNKFTYNLQTNAAKKEYLKPNKYTVNVTSGKNTDSTLLEVWENQK
jgi:photosystem II stability/assembly factor-like uncharacterized protein